METLETSCVCRLCGKHSGISIDIFDKNENHVKKINAILPIMVHEMDLLPKHMCHRCSYKLEEFHKFYVDCLKTDTDLKSQLSWMRKDVQKSTGVPMVQIENVKIKVEPPDDDIFEQNSIEENDNYIKSMNSESCSMNNMQKEVEKRLNYNTYSTYPCYFQRKYRNKIINSNNFVKSPNNSENRKNISLANKTETKFNKLQRSVCTRFQSKEIADSLKSSNIDIENSNNTNPLQIIKRNLFKSNVFHDRQVKDLSVVQKKVSINSNSSVKTNKPFRSPVRRNLRPRRASIDYVGNKRKKGTRTSNGENRLKNNNFEVPEQSMSLNIKIKEEIIDDAEIRILRSRKYVINSVGNKTKKRNQRKKVSDSKEYEHDKSMFSVKENNSISVKNRSRFSLKNKLIEKLEKTALGISKNEIGRNKKIENGVIVNNALPENLLTNVDNTLIEFNRSNYSKNPKNLNMCTEVRSSSSLSKDKSGIINVRHSLDSVIREKLKSDKGMKHLHARVNFKTKYRKNEHTYLRNGKLKPLGTGDALRSFNISGTIPTKKWHEIIDNNTSVTKFRRKLIEYKQYCEKCNTSFMNKELFRLHACYFD